MAILMQQHEIAHRVRSAQAPRQDVVEMPPRFCRDFLVAYRTDSSLEPPKPAKPLSILQRLKHASGEPPGKIVIKRRIVGIGLRCDLGVFALVYATQTQQKLVLFPETPVTTLQALKIALP